ncbi:MAG: MerR family transcriptional regulator [Clostridiales bacterium]|nr:MerR family transcriptional regulator [Clostridiales bacterium]
MDDKMTSGEIAKKAGVSQKAVRLYDEKGLLKPTDYSDGNYRLYDKEALQILEKIVALKQIGFSLEEIRDNLTSGDARDIKEALKIQLSVMEEKRYKLDMVIDAINRTLARGEDSLDWDDVADIVKSVTLDQTADLAHWKALQHSVSEDWYVQIFRTMGFGSGNKVLDLGCGFSKIWRNNWDIIPEGTKIYAYDLPGTWADDFANFIEENTGSLPENVDIDLTFSDLDKADTWDKIDREQKYDRIIAHYIFDEVKNIEAIVERASIVLSPDGFFSVNGPDVTTWDQYFKDALAQAGIKEDFLDEKIAQSLAERDEYLKMLGKYFAKVETIELQSSFRFDDADDVLECFRKRNEAQAKFFSVNEKKIKEYFAGRIEEEGQIVITTTSHFQHCSN